MAGKVLFGGKKAPAIGSKGPISMGMEMSPKREAAMTPKARAAYDKVEPARVKRREGGK